MIRLQRRINVNILGLKNFSIKAMSLGPIHTAIEQKLTLELKPLKLLIENESHKHASHSAMRGVDSKETHFKITVVSDLFQGKTLMQQHRLIYDILKEEMGDGKIHALSLKTSKSLPKSSE
ncbi:BolA domain UV induced protein Uvi31 [Entomophthora muscae]|uniref:BolA domain UV induced protein Uvi31 n=1 Tax=Entomophthora muscae TaxID=34485 RepID=A0ACC2TD98_9FUNG|nr:BolA domain UV induced protein Uvi31 [Entomophthora muscae]